MHHQHGVSELELKATKPHFLKQQTLVELEIRGARTMKIFQPLLTLSCSFCIYAKFYDDLVPDLPRIPYIDDVSARATVDAMQAQGPPLPKVDVKSLYDNSLLKTIEAELDRDKRR